MNGDDLDSVVRMLHGVYGRWTRETTVARMRTDWDDAFRDRAEHWPVEHVRIGETHAEWISAPEADPARVILFLHGGGFRIGSVDSHRDLIQRISRAAKARVLAIDYRLSPEHMFPAPVEDALASYRWLLASGVEHGQIAFAGDSAGGGLAISCMLAARDAGLPAPCAAYLMSPWTDLAASGASYETRAALDPMHQRAMILGMARGYLGKTGDPRNPLASPLYADLRGLPPLLIQCGGREVILDDSVVFAARARATGVAVDLKIFEPMIHVFQTFSELKSAGDAIGEAGAFLADRIRTEQGAMTVSVEIEDHVAIVRLNRPDKMNALNPDMFEQLLLAGDRVRERPDVRCVVLAGEGRAFCAGIDRQRFSGGAAIPPPLAPRTHGVANLPQKVVLQWRELAPPVIASVHGVAFGAGFQLALGADMRYVAPDTKLSIMEVEWGLVPDMCGTVLMAGLAGDDVARELTYSGAVFSGEEAKTYGLATRVMANPLDAALAKAREIAGKSPSSVQAAKRLFNRRLEAQIKDGLLAESMARDALVSHPNQREAAAARLEGRPPRFVDPAG